MEADLLGFDLQFRSVLVADGQPKRAVGFQHAMHTLDPPSTPAQVVVGAFRIVVDVVLVANVERWVGKNQIDGTVVGLIQQVNAIALINAVPG
jgi:hypothetical protein